MSESEEHRTLVIEMAKKICSISPTIYVKADLPITYGYHKPSKVQNHRPDVYGVHPETNARYIAEAKTYSDIETDRSTEQIREFIEHVCQHPSGLFILGALGNGARVAKSKLRFLIEKYEFDRGVVCVYDGLDHWILTDKGHYVWHSY